jgi:Uncharacterized conserved protein
MTVEVITTSLTLAETVPALAPQLDRARAELAAALEAATATASRLTGAPRVVSASREIAASPELIFELIADPAQQPRWDGNDNLAEAAAGQRVRAVGDVFIMTLTGGHGQGEPRGRVRGRPPHRLAPVRGGPKPAGPPVALGA